MPSAPLILTCWSFELRQRLLTPLPLADLDPLLLEQRWWSSQLLEFHRSALVASVPLRDRKRLQCLLLPLSGAWLSPVPAKELGLNFLPDEFRVVVSWRLGLRKTVTKECPQCGEAQDPFGDHEVCCRKSDFWARHQTVADALARVCTSSGLHAEREVGVEGRERPADLLVRGLGP